MDRETSIPYNREVLKQQLQTIEQQIALADSQGQTGPEVNLLHQEHARITEELAEPDSGHDDMAAAA